ncbi:hypothetical protein [Candidatus Clostridium radicumherbarum]|jgi:hypothetical protein|uniref:Uncharacterized protein n=1 Tax=Candidatus Clostridium radicumherbarum TaxID=3381662 RepID=A0ABW8TS63_9CLOT
MKSNKVKKESKAKKILSSFSEKPMMCIDSEGKVSDFCVISITKGLF